MKKFAAFTLSLALVLLVLAAPAALAQPGWLTTEWYGQYFGLTAPNTPDPAPAFPEPQPLSPAEPSLPADPPPSSPAAGQPASAAWLSPDWFSSYFGGSTSPVAPAQPPVSGDPVAGPAPAPSPGGEMTSLEAQLFQLLNNERAQRGLRPLQADSTLTRLARLKSQDMVDNNYFGHNSPTYGTLSDLLRRYQVSYKMAGENLAKARSVASAHSLFLNSSVHRSTMLSDRFSHVGIGVVPQATGGGVMVSEIFIQK